MGNARNANIQCTCTLIMKHVHVHDVYIILTISAIVERNKHAFIQLLKLLGYIRNIHGETFIILWYDSNNSTFPLKK